MKLEDLLTHKSFLKLEQLRTHWKLTHISHDGVSISAICDKDLDRMVATYAEVVESIDSVSEGDSSHDHEFIPSAGGDRLLCSCGAWKQRTEA